MFTLPTPDRRFYQLNEGDGVGNVYSTYGIDFQKNKGKIRPSSLMKKAIDETGTATFDQPAGAFKYYNSRYWSFTTDMFVNNSATDPTSGWAQDATAGSPSPSLGQSDMEVFKGLLLVSGTGAGSDDIYAYNGSTWSSWWKGTLGQSGLSSTGYKPLCVGPNNVLFIIDARNKVYRVDSTPTVTKTGNGTLDFSSVSQKMVCMEANSSRLWIGTIDSDGVEGTVIEWDMSANASTANRVHKIGAIGCVAIAIHNDIPYAVLTDGRIKYFNGSSFVDFEGMQFPFTTSSRILDDNTQAGYVNGGDTFMHPNGWAIIDDMVHFLVGNLVTGSDITDTYDSARKALVEMPAGIYCLDPKIGLYHRFALTKSVSSQIEEGQRSVLNTGALYASKSSTARFLCSYEYFADTAGTGKAILAYGDPAQTYNARAILTTSFFEEKDSWREIESLHKKVPSGSKIKYKYRQFASPNYPIHGDANWTSTTTFNTTDDLSNAKVGDEVTITMQKGGNTTAHIQSIELSSTVYTVTLDEAIPYVASGDTSSFSIEDFYKIGTVDSDGLDWKNLEIPSSTQSRKMQLRIELYQSANTEVELDRVTINP